MTANHIFIHINLYPLLEIPKKKKRHILFTSPMILLFNIHFISGHYSVIWSLLRFLCITFYSNISKTNYLLLVGVYPGFDVGKKLSTNLPIAMLFTFYSKDYLTLPVILGGLVGLVIWNSGLSLN